jgi:hypothetical protein
MAVLLGEAFGVLVVHGGTGAGGGTWICRAGSVERDIGTEGVCTWSGVFGYRSTSIPLQYYTRYYLSGMTRSVSPVFRFFVLYSLGLNLDLFIPCHFISPRPGNMAPGARVAI